MSNAMMVIYPYREQHIAILNHYPYREHKCDFPKIHL